MALTKKRIDDALGSFVVRKNGRYFTHESNVDAIIHRITGSFNGCYASVEAVGTVGKKIVIGNALSRVSKPLVEIFIRDDV